MSDICPLVHIVDADPAVRRALKRLLCSWGMQARTFASGPEFLSALNCSDDGDCSLIDVQMPGMNGLEVQDRMKRAGVDLPVIFITAHEEEGVEARALREGAVGFLRKPFSDEVLVELIRKVVWSRKVRKDETLRAE